MKCENVLPALSEILQLCLKIDSIAFVQYHNFAKIANTEDDKNFWILMAEDEKSHVEFWRKNYRKAIEGKLPEILDEPQNTYIKLKNILDELLRLPKKTSYDKKDALETALQIESHLLMPEFLIMFNFFSEENDKENIEAYSSHINRLIVKIHESKEFIKLKFLLENMVNLFKKNLELATKSFEDPLTGLLNRRAFYGRAIPLTELAYRENKGIAIIIIDIDKFKEINDNFGHLEGDKIIVKLANILKTSTRKYDLLCRFGGEEFLILSISEDPADVKNITERLRQKVEKELKINDEKTVTISIGAKFENKNISSLQFLNELIKSADENLYTAKKTGRNKVILS